MSKILITGAAGFVGWHLAMRLSAEPGNELTLVDNFVRGRRDDDLETLLARPNVRLISADLSDAAAYEQLGQSYDHVYHLAAIIGVKNVMSRPYDVVRVNALTTLHLLEWLRNGGGAKILFSSTSEAYAWTQQFHTLPIPTPENVPLALTDIGNARSSYAGSKVFGELAVTHGCASIGKAFTIVRYHNVYGPRMGFEHVIPELFQRSIAGQNPLVVYSANHSRAFCYIDDAISATIAAMENPVADNATINIGNDAEVTIGELATEVLAVAGVSPKVETQVAAHDPIHRRCPDISRARALLGYEPKVSLRSGLEKTLAWYRPHLAARNS
ncbi:MAG TPA: NAD-dependent epimerase/dehydratase family protein [Chthoniobacter sp.]|nr:NAD-dependent epimerase/dehydratase family protein [Chthoniobacter sp.]